MRGREEGFSPPGAAILRPLLAAAMRGVRAGPGARGGRPPPAGLRGRAAGSVSAAGTPEAAAAGDTTRRLALRPGLYVVGTPIGNLDDITVRAINTLRSVDGILAEDTRNTARLLAAHGITGQRLVSYHEHNKQKRQRGGLDQLRNGDALALVSDAGTPG